MQSLIKKISMLFLVVSLGWFPIQVTFATSFVLPIQSNTLTSSISSNQVIQNLLQKDETKQTNCKMHKMVSDCCHENSLCNSSGQDCSNCVSFIAMAHEQQQTYIIPLYSSHYTQNYGLSGLAVISNYRPPRNA